MTDKTLIIVEDDETFARTLARSFERREYKVYVVHGPAELDQALQTVRPDYAVVDLKLGNSSGLPCIRTLHQHNAAMRIVVLTGYASIGTAVEAIKLGASQYLPKPCNTDDIEAAFRRDKGDEAIPISTRPTTIKTLEWEHINEALAETGFNISETARRLGMHRRTLARKLTKRPIR
ncbi:MAG: response regulator transcription factor [Sphingomonas bacterium]|nr:response regulator transcription factor [Sphingomonas bacterium]